MTMAILLASMRANALRLWLIGVLAVAAIVSVVANKANSPWIGWVSFALFLVRGRHVRPAGAAPPAKSAVLEFSTERRKPMRLALAQINSVVGDVDGNAARVVEWLDRARDANADLVLFPELVRHRATRPRTCSSAPASCARRGARSRRSRRRLAAIDRARRRAAPRHRPLQRLLRPRPRRGARRLPQALPAELRRLRRGPLLRPRQRPATCSASATCSSARRSARTSGSRGRPRPTSRSRARS